MRNQFFLLTVLAVTFWTGRGDQTQIGQRTVGQREDGPQSLDSARMLSNLKELIERIKAMKSGKEPGTDGIHDKLTKDDFYLDDLAVGSGGWNSDDIDDSDWESSMSEYPGSDFDSEGSGSAIDSDYSEPAPSQETVYGSIHLNKVFKKEYLDPESMEYSMLETNFILSMDETMENSPLKANYITTHVRGFSPGSVQVEFDIELQNFGNDNPVIEDSVSQIISDGVSKGRFDRLSANASSLVVRVSPSDPEVTTPSKTDNEIPPEHTKPSDDDNNTINTKNSIYREDDDEVDKEEKDIFEMILGDPIIIAAIVGGLIVILLSVILLFLFVVYRLKKKDEGSYSLDEPAKSKDPTAYWKETKEFYA